jgi:ABC-2 type transport system ATP-binding protein
VDDVIEVRGLTKRYGDRTALDGLDLRVRRGEVFSLLGPNGAGKTTTVEILEGYRRRDAGGVRVLGHDPAHGDRRWRSRIGIVPQGVGAFAELTVEETVRHFASLYPDPLDPLEALELVDLAEHRRLKGTKLSGGQRRRLDVAVGVVGDPELIFLDEPTTGLDPVARRRAWSLVERLTTRGKTVLLTTHYLDEAEALAHRVAVIAGGRLVEVAAPRDLGGRSRAAATVSFAWTGPLAERPVPELRNVSERVETAGKVVRVATDSPTAVIAVLAGWTAQAGLREIPALTVARPTLEETYLRMIAAHDITTKRHSAADGGAR